MIWALSVVDVIMWRDWRLRRTVNVPGSSWNIFVKGDDMSIEGGKAAQPRERPCTHRGDIIHRQIELPQRLQTVEGVGRNLCDYVVV